MTYQREFTTRLSVAVVGVGNHSYRNVLPCLHHLPVKLVAVCDVNAELAERTAAEFGCKAYASAEEMYASEQLDAVFLCVSPAHHPALAIQAFEAGVHVWMEKPAAMRAYEVEEMLDKRNGFVAVVGFNKAFMPSTVKAIEIASSAEHGNLRSM